MVLDNKQTGLLLVGLAALAGVYWVKQQDKKTDAPPKVENPWDVSFYPSKINLFAQPRTKRYPQSLEACWSNAQNMDSGVAMFSRGGGYSGRNLIY